MSWQPCKSPWQCVQGRWRVRTLRHTAGHDQVLPQLPASADDIVQLRLAGRLHGAGVYQPQVGCLPLLVRHQRVAKSCQLACAAQEPCRIKAGHPSQAAMQARTVPDLPPDGSFLSPDMYSESLMLWLRAGREK